MTPDEFIEWLGSSAQQQCACYGLPASVVIAQGALESGWGKDVIGEYNFFGRKWNGEGNYIEVPTQEYWGGEYHSIVAKFQDYDSLLAAIDDWCILITQEPCYSEAYGAWCEHHDIEEFVRFMAEHYATDPDYADKVLSTIRANDLERYDG